MRKGDEATSSCAELIKRRGCFSASRRIAMTWFIAIISLYLDKSRGYLSYLQPRQFAPAPRASYAARWLRGCRAAFLRHSRYKNRAHKWCAGTMGGAASHRKATAAPHDKASCSARHGSLWFGTQSSTSTLIYRRFSLTNPSLFLRLRNPA